VDGQVDGDFLVAAAQVLHERVTGCDCAQRVDRLHTSDQPQAGFEWAVIGFHAVIGIPLAGVAPFYDVVLSRGRRR
jgi:hypothetical protein